MVGYEPATYFNGREVKWILGIDKSTYDHRIQQGVLKGEKVGKFYTFSKDVIEEYIKGRWVYQKRRQYKYDDCYFETVDTPDKAY